MDLSLLDMELRSAAFIEAADVFVGMVAKPDAKQKLLQALAQLWALPEQHAPHYEHLHKPNVQGGTGEVQVGGQAVQALTCQCLQMYLACC